ncbi:hypothetical protein [Uliginosibacterium sp. TH139]|uniref:hypothetical protein n=1 Tax=Uliginosibacterium sp. TH139 TaxID=2067453 RepID=UPI0011812DA3|nr:hypothetical protein [Uliginosibacterium sp. TH139]
MSGLTLRLVMLLCCLVSARAGAVDALPSAESMPLWQEQPWALRYILKLDAPYFFDIRATRGKKKLSEARPGQEQEIEAVAQGVRTYVVENAFLEREEVFASLLLEFNRSGELVSRHSSRAPLFGHLAQDDELVLASGNGTQDFVFGLGQWQTASLGEGSGTLPALCSKEDEQRYRPNFRPSSVLGGFGCREWRAYLENRKLPYIDVTSYELEDDRSAKPDRKGRYPQRILATIRPVIGWGRFDLPAKPVIGRHGKSWFCLHDCPGGDFPGFIPNIASWAARSGWPVPKPPKRMPLFPDPAS